MMATDYGRDISCTTELRLGRFASGPALVAEAAYRRLTTPRGMLRGGEEEANYGLDLTELVGSVKSDADIAAIPGRVELELRKDERLNGATMNVTATRSVVGPSATVEIVIECTLADGTFSLVLGVNDVTVELLGLTAEAA